MSRDILRLPSDDFARSLNPKGMFVRMEEGKERKSAEVRGQSQRQGSETARLLIGHLGEPTHQQRLPREALSIIYFNPNICTLNCQRIRGQIQAAIGKALDHGGSYKYVIKSPSPRLVFGHSAGLVQGSATCNFAYFAKARFLIGFHCSKPRCFRCRPFLFSL
jgi:hypothetical protein